MQMTTAFTILYPIGVPVIIMFFTGAQRGQNPASGNRHETALFFPLRSLKN